MRRLFALASATLLAVALASPVAAGDPMRPISSTLVGQVTYPPATQCLLPIITTTDAAGVTTHLGLTTMHSTHCFAPPNRVTGGEMELTAANGDQVFGTYEGTTVPDMPSVVGETVVVDFDIVITGGTGRFTGASGTMAGKAWVIFPGWQAPSWPARFALSGSIAY